MPGVDWRGKLEERTLPGTLPPIDFEKCLAIISQGFLAVQSYPSAAAEKLPRIVEVLTQALPADQRRDLQALTLYTLSGLRLRQGRGEESQQLQERAIACLQEGGGSDEARQNAGFQQLMAHALTQVEDYRGAVQFWERAIDLEGSRDVIQAADMLWHVGECYGRSGLRDHAAISLRSALKVFRNYPEDPRYSAVLIALGNVLSKSSVGEAERCYLEVAEFHEGRAELEDATVPWVNLGILCSEQNRHEESLAYYQKALRVREQSAETPAERMGSLHNNIANCHRRMGRFAEAHEAVERAIAVLGPKGGERLASAYGTQGEIFRDEQRDADAVEWLRKSYELRMEVKSPNLEHMVENLEHEIAALKRLGWLEKAAIAQKQLATVRAKMDAMPKVERNEGTAPLEGTLVIELGAGKRSQEEKRDCVRLALRLADVVEEKQAGFYRGYFVTLEHTVLLFYGKDAEELYHAVVSILDGEPLCEGARVTIRQGGMHREIMLPGPTM